MTNTLGQSDTGIAIQTFPAPAIDYGIADATIEDLRSRYTGLKIEGDDDYKKVQLAIADIRRTRTGVEKSRQALKSGALEYGRKVDAEAKRVTQLLEEIEAPLVAERLRVDNIVAEAKARAEREARERAEAEAAEAKRIEDERIAAQRAAEQAEIQRQRDAIEAERQAVAIREQELAESRRRFEEEKQAEIDRLNAEREAEARERERLEIERQAAIKFEQDRVAEELRIQREQLEAERAEIQRLEIQRLEEIAKAEAAERAAEEARLAKIAAKKLFEETADDRVIIQAFASEVSELKVPELSSVKGKAVAEKASESLFSLLVLLCRFSNSGEIE